MGDWVRWRAERREAHTEEQRSLCANAVWCGRRKKCRRSWEMLAVVSRCDVAVSPLVASHARESWHDFAGRSGMIRVGMIFFRS